MSKRAHRYFRCRYCNHRLRFGAHECGSCYQPTQMANRVPTWTVLGVALLLSGGVVAAATLPTILQAKDGTFPAQDSESETEMKASL